MRTPGAGWGSETGPRPHEVEPGNVHVYKCQVDAEFLGTLLYELLI